VPDGQRVNSNEGREFRLDKVAFDALAGDRIGTIEDDDRQASLGCSFLDQAQRRNIGRKTHSDVLDIEDQRLKIVQHGRCGLARFAVQAMDWPTSAGVNGLGNMDASLVRAARAMLRTEEGRKANPVAGGQEVDGAAQARVDARLIGNQPNALALDRGWETIFEQSLQARSECHKSSSATGRRCQ
jgi:hypothetical protein